MGLSNGELARDKWLRRAIIANVVLGLAFVVSLVFFAWRAHFQIPYMDDWDWIASFRDSETFSRSLWQLHNEHLLVIPKLLVWMDLALWGWPGYLTLVSGVLAHVAVAAVLIDCAFRRFEPPIALLLTGSILVLIFLTYQLQGLVFPAAVMFPLVTAFATVAIWLVDRAGDAASAARRRARLVLSAAATLLAMLTMTNGLALPFLLAAIAFQVRLSVRTVVAFVLLGLAGVALRYLIGGLPGSALTSSPLSVATFALAFLAGFVASVSAPTAVALGALSLAWTARCTWLTLRRGTARGAEWTLIGIITFGLFSAALAAPSRAIFGLNNAAQSRYVILVCAYWAALLVLSVPVAGLRGRAGRSLAVVLPALALIALPVQLLVGLVWVAKADHLQTAALTLAAGVSDDDWIWRLHVLGEPVVRPGFDVLAARHVPFTEFPDRGLVSANAGSVGPLCHGEIDASDPNLISQSSTGLRIAAHVRERGDRLLITDADHRIRGLARPAPLVPYGRAYANDFVWAVVMHLIRPSDNSDQQWQGFSAPGSGGPYVAELRSANGGLICRAPVKCCSAPPPRTPLRILVGADAEHR